MMHHSGAIEPRECFFTSPPLSYPAHAGYPVFQRPFMDTTDASGILGRPVKPDDDSRERGSGVLHLRPNSFSISASFNST